MANNNPTMSFDFTGLEAFQKNLEHFTETGVDDLFKDTAKALTRSLLTEVKDNTVVGVAPEDLPDDIYNKYWSGYKGGQLRDSWNPQDIQKKGDTWSCGIQTNVEYALYYEYGHRQDVGRFVPALGKKLKKPFVEGHYTVDKAMKATIRKAPKIGEAIINRHLNKMNKGK